MSSFGQMPSGLGLNTAAAIVIVSIISVEQNNAFQ